MILAGLFFILWTGIGFFGEDLGYPWYTYLIYMVSVIGVTVIKFLVKQDFTRVGKLLGFVGILGLSYGIMGLSSLFIWYVDLQEMTYISRGISRILYQIIGIGYAVSAVYLFGERTGYLVFYGFLFGNIYLFLKVMMQFGIGTFVSDFIVTVTSMATVETASMRALEVHDETFAFGVWLLYFWINRKNTKMPILHILFAGVFFLIGFKRIAILSVLCIMMLSVLLAAVKKHRHILFMAAGAIQVFACYGYLVLVKDGWLRTLTERFGIDTMGRMDLYDRFLDLYDLGVRFLGFGMGYTSRLITNWYETGIINHSFGSLHNDILTMYLEIGFVGFLVWLLYETVIRYPLMDLVYGREAGILFFLTGTYVFLTYFSDNTHFYPAIQAVGYLAPMLAYVSTQRKPETKGDVSCEKNNSMCDESDGNSVLLSDRRLLLSDESESPERLDDHRTRN